MSNFVTADVTFSHVGNSLVDDLEAGTCDGYPTIRRTGLSAKVFMYHLTMAVCQATHRHACRSGSCVPYQELIDRLALWDRDSNI